MLAVIRYQDERTLGKCKQALEAQFGYDSAHGGRVCIVQTRPFFKAVQQCFEIALKSGYEWLVTVDADVIIAPDYRQQLEQRITRQDWHILGMMDCRLSGTVRLGGPRAWRISKLKGLTVNDVPRPEAELVRRNGFTLHRDWITCRHGYDQWLSYYYKAGANPKWQQQKQWHDRWRQSRDPDLKAAYKGLTRQPLRMNDQKPSLTFVCFKWRGPDPARLFTHVHVNALYRMLAANYRKPFRFVCITDDASGLVEQIKTLPLPDMQDIAAPQGEMYPSCYRRLWLFSAEAAKVLPGKIVCIDIDVVICGDVTEFFDRPEPCVFWHDADTKWLKYSGGLWMITTGTRCEVWDRFDSEKSPQITKDAQLLGSDQAWISYVLDGEAGWDRSHGIWRTRNLVPGCEPLILQTGNIHKPWTKSFSKRHKRFAEIWQSYATEPEAPKPMLEKGKYRILKRCTSGQRGDIVELTADEAEHMRRMGLIGSHRIESKRPEVLK